MVRHKQNRERLQTAAADENIRGVFLELRTTDYNTGDTPDFAVLPQSDAFRRCRLALRFDSAFADEITQVIVDGWRWSARIRMRQRRLRP